MSTPKEGDRYQIVWLIRRLFRAFGQAADDMLRSRGISAADRAVMEFLYPRRELSVPEIARKYSVSRQHVQVTVNSLVNKGHARRAENPRHKRSPLIRLTKAGRELFDCVFENDMQALDALFANVPEADARITRKTLRLLLDELQEQFEQ